MFCSHCGSGNSEGSVYCINCGHSLSQQTGSNVPVNGFQGIRQTRELSACGSALMAQVPQEQEGSRSVYAKGCLGAAWYDLRSSEGWLKKMLLLSLLEIVPILNFIVPGYAMKWAKKLVLGRSEPLPERVFENGAFSRGFFWSVLSAVFVLLLGAVDALLTVAFFFAPVIGLVVFPVAAVFVNMFSYLCGMRIAISGRLSEGFNWSKAFESCRRHLGSLFCATCVAWLLVVALSCLVILIVSVFFSIMFGVGVAGVATLSGEGLFGASFGTGGFSGLAVVAVIASSCILLYSVACAVAFGMILSFRAVAHWVCRFSPEWVSELTGASADHYAQGHPSTQATSVQNWSPSIAIGLSSYGVGQSTTSFSGQPAGFTSSFEDTRDARTTVLDGDDGLDRSTIVLAGNKNASASRSLVLVRANGDRIILDAFPATIGKGSMADVRIGGNNSISRVHARVIYARGIFAIEDMQSTNGTLVNGNPLALDEVVALHDGDALTLGKEVFTVRFRE